MSSARSGYKFEFTPAAIRDLEKLDPQVRRKIFADIGKLASNPRPAGVEKLEAKEKLYRVYVGKELPGHLSDQRSVAGSPDCESGR